MQRPIHVGGPVSYGQPFAADPGAYSRFGLAGHHGFDYPAPIGTAVFAPEGGVVTISANGARDPYTGRPVAGETIVIRGMNYEHWLLHLSTRIVGQGQQVG